MSRYWNFLASLLIFSTSWGWVQLESVHAETVTSERIQSAIRLIPLQKVTVGPDDQYHGTADGSESILVFTRKSDLVPSLYGQALKTGHVTSLLPADADSQEPALSPAGELAFTYYKFHASGDICHRPFQGLNKKNEKISCLPLKEGEPTTPFWKSSTELGFLLKESFSPETQIQVIDLKTNEKKTLAQGKVWSPAMQPGGRYLFFNEMVEKNGKFERQLIMKDLQTGKTKPILFELPGISGFPAVSGDLGPDLHEEKYLYFSHYLNDTNRDNIIDGNDNSVVFRIPIEKLHGSNPVFPEQLTSAESNCSFPRPARNSVYLTCAFEGALDIYKIPLTGIVPQSWGPEQLKNAHETSRSYSERILLQNVLKYRFPEKAVSELNDRILSNHIMLDDLASAKYYLEKVKSQSSAEGQKFYSLLNFYLEAREVKNIQKFEEVTPALKLAVSQAERKIDQIQSYSRFRSILKGLLESFLGRTEASSSFLKKVDTREHFTPLERYYYFELAQWVLLKQRNHSQLYEVYRDMIRAPELPEEAQIYYAFQFLKLIETDHSSLTERIAQIRKLNHGLPQSSAALLNSEEITLQLIQEKDTAAKTQSYRKLDQLMSESRSHFFLRKALYIRSILNFAKAADFKFLNFIATNWLRYTENKDTEYSNARDVFVFANLDRAYDQLNQNHHELASNYFYSAMSWTDDLESHFGYIRTQSARGQRKEVDTVYKNLKSHRQIEDHIKYVEALLTLIDAPHLNENGPLDRALDKLNSMEEDRNSSVRYLLLGYCYLKKLLNAPLSYDFDQDLFQTAHLNLMLAYDQAWDNDRVKASALMNLGILHQRVLNHGLSARFFANRKALGFLNSEEEARFAWLYSKSLFHNYQPLLASEEISKTQGKLPESFVIPFLERKAFYLQASKEFAKAADAYQKLLQSKPILEDINFAKIYLSYGFCLFKLNRSSEAQKILEKALVYINQLQATPKGKDRWIEFQPLRLKLVAYGLLSQLGNLDERLKSSEKRGEYLREAKGVLDQWQSTVIQNALQTAYLAEKTDLRKSASHLTVALKNAEEMGNSGQYLSHAVYQAVVGYLTVAIRHSKLAKPGEMTEMDRSENSERIEKLVNQILETYDRQTISQPILNEQKAKLKKLWNTYLNQ